MTTLLIDTHDMLLAVKRRMALKPNRFAPHWAQILHINAKRYVLPPIQRR